jgi:hypothetical protein
MTATTPSRVRQELTSSHSTDVLPKIRMLSVECWRLSILVVAGAENISLRVVSKKLFPSYKGQCSQLHRTNLLTIRLIDAYAPSIALRMLPPEVMSRADDERFLPPYVIREALVTTTSTVAVVWARQKRRTSMSTAYQTSFGQRGCFPDSGYTMLGTIATGPV